MLKIFLLITCVWLVCGQDIPIVPLPTNPPRTTTTTTTTTPATTTPTTTTTSKPIVTSSTTREPPSTTRGPPSTTRQPISTTRRPTTTRITTRRPTIPNTTKGYPCREQNCFYYKLFITSNSFHCKRCCTMYNKKFLKCFFVPSYKCGPNAVSRSHSGHHHVKTKY